MHDVVGYPVKSTWVKAVKAGNFKGWPLVTKKNVKPYYPDTDETPKGHLNQTRKNVRSTKLLPFWEADTKTLFGKKKRDVYVKVDDMKERSYSDQTGKFPITSHRGNKYITVMVDIDSSAILVEPMKSQEDEEMKRAYRVMMKQLRQAGVVPKKHVLDNEISESIKDMIRDEFKMQVELVPLGCHRQNAAEVAIQNFKAHFLSILAGTAEDFPLSLWDRLLPQAKITINLLRQANADPTKSAYAYLCGPFDYNRMPLAPIGCRVQDRKNTDQRGTWAYRSDNWWCLFTSLEHYRVHNCHIKDTRHERLSDTVQFMHKNITNPMITQADKLMIAIQRCTNLIQGNTTEDCDDAIRELQQIVDVATTAYKDGILHEIDENEQAISRVPSTPIDPFYSNPDLVMEDPNQRVTRAMQKRINKRTDNTPFPRVDKQPVPRVNE